MTLTVHGEFTMHKLIAIYEPTLVTTGLILRRLNWKDRIVWYLSSIRLDELLTYTLDMSGKIGLRQLQLQSKVQTKSLPIFSQMSCITSMTKVMPITSSPKPLSTRLRQDWQLLVSTWIIQRIR